MTKLIAALLAAVVSTACSQAVPQDTAPDTANSLDGKKAAFFGDSVCYGTNYEGGYAKLIGEELGIETDNFAKGGASVARGVKWSADSDGVRPCIIDMANSIEGDYDYIIAEGGINDFWNHTEIGALTEGFDGGYNEETFAGGLEATFSAIRENHPESRTAFVIIHDPFTYDAEDSFAPYYEMMRSACGKWQVECIDLYAANNAQTGVNVRDAEIKDLYFGSEERPGGDGTHPNELGYQTIYTEPIINWMRGAF